MRIREKKPSTRIRAMVLLGWQIEKLKKYENRSEAIRKAVHEFVQKERNKKKIANGHGKVIAATLYEKDIKFLEKWRGKFYVSVSEMIRRAIETFFDTEDYSEANKFNIMTNGGIDMENLKFERWENEFKKMSLEELRKKYPQLPDYKYINEQ